MQYLLDTHALLWIVSDDARLSKKVKSIYLNPENEIFVSIASLWEITVKLSRNRLEIKTSLEDFVQNDVIGNDIAIMPIRLSHLYTLRDLPFYHSDPFDRLIISQSKEEKIPVLGIDKIFDKYKIKRVWK